MKIANIVSSSKISVSDNFNVVQSIQDIITGLPTLIVGFDYVNKNYPDFNITNILIEKDLYWTFKRTERRDKFEEDLNWFVSMVYLELTKQIEYIFIDPIQGSKETIIDSIKRIKAIKNIITYVHGEMLYVYGLNTIFGIDLKLLRFMSMNTTKIKNKIKSISSVFLEDDKILIEYKNNVGILGNQVRFIPFLYSINHGQNDSSSLIYFSRKS